MNCIDYRRLITSDPSHTGAEALRHRMACQACAAFSSQMQGFDAQLREAMTIATPKDLESHVILAAAGQSVARNRWLGVAATLLLTVGVTLGVMKYNYRVEKLPEQVVQHMYHEANLLVPVSTDLVPAPRLRQVLERTGVKLNEDVANVIHAGVCHFRGHLVSHLVVMSDQGPITVLLLPKEEVATSMTINENGFHGVIVPVKGGSIAIVGAQSSYPAQLERQFTQAVDWDI